MAALAVVTLYSCQKDKNLSSTPPDDDVITSDVQKQIKAHGFSASNAHKVKEGYLVEGDILLTPEFLNTNSKGKVLQTAEAEQYRTTNLVTRLPRTITIKVSNLGTSFVNGTDEAIRRYNALGLTITFQRISSGNPNITIQGYNEPPRFGYITLGSSGFPTSSGDPYNTIKMNTNRFAFGTNPNALYIASVIQHEIGHCIGFRHTDYMNRSYSCGGSAVNEGASTMGAEFIPGTPSGPDPNSWMLACSDGSSRTFNANDITALNYLY
jgi:hypothetical protein